MQRAEDVASKQVIKHWSAMGDNSTWSVVMVAVSECWLVPSPLKYVVRKPQRKRLPSLTVAHFPTFLELDLLHSQIWFRIQVVKRAPSFCWASTCVVGNCCNQNWQSPFYPSVVSDCWGQLSVFCCWLFGTYVEELQAKPVASAKMLTATLFGHVWMVSEA